MVVRKLYLLNRISKWRASLFLAAKQRRTPSQFASGFPLPEWRRKTAFFSSAFGAFAELGRTISQSLPTVRKAVFDGEIVCADRKGRPQFKDLLFHKGNPCFFAFDLLHDGKDRRLDALVERKQNLRRLLVSLSKHSRIKYADHFDGLGSRLFERICALDLEGILRSTKAADMKRG